MKNKLTQFIPALVAFLVIGFRYFSTWCIGAISACYGSWIHQAYRHLTYPLYSFSLYFLPIAIILIFIPRHIFNSWLKFATWSLPLIFILVATQPVVSGMFSTDRNDAVRFAGQVFAVVSLLLIVYRALRSARTKNIKV